MASKAERREITQNRLKAMSHPLRAEILRILVERVASPAELGRELEADTPNVAHHVKRLVELDCAELISTRPVRGATEHFYRATERSLISLEEWEALNPAKGEWLLAEIFQKKIDDFIASERAHLLGRDKDFHLTRTPIMLDAEGLQEGMEVYERARLEMIEVERRVAERASPDRFPASSSLTLIRVPRTT